MILKKMDGQMSYDEFKKTIFYTKNKLIIPLLGRISIDKINFFDKTLKRKNKYSFEKEDKFLKELYEKNKHKLK